jgi:hypothetical protein
LPLARKLRLDLAAGRGHYGDVGEAARARGEERDPSAIGRPRDQVAVWSRSAMMPFVAACGRPAIDIHHVRLRAPRTNASDLPSGESAARVAVTGGRDLCFLPRRRVGHEEAAPDLSLRRRRLPAVWRPRHRPTPAPRSSSRAPRPPLFADAARFLRAPRYHRLPVGNGEVLELAREPRVFGRGPRGVPSG